MYEEALPNEERVSVLVAVKIKVSVFPNRRNNCSTVVELGDFLEKMLRSLEELLLIFMSPRVAGKDKSEVLLEFRAGGSTLAVNSSFAIRNASSVPIKPGITESIRCLAVPIAYQIYLFKMGFVRIL